MADDVPAQGLGGVQRRVGAREELAASLGMWSKVAASPLSVQAPMDTVTFIAIGNTEQIGSTPWTPR